MLEQGTPALSLLQGSTAAAAQASMRSAAQPGQQLLVVSGLQPQTATLTRSCPCCCRGSPLVEGPGTQSALQLQPRQTVHVHSVPPFPGWGALLIGCLVLRPGMCAAAAPEEQRVRLKAFVYDQMCSAEADGAMDAPWPEPPACERGWRTASCVRTA